MYWYLAKLSFQIICGEGNHKAQFDEQLRLIYAGSKDEAIEKAGLLGKKDEEMFLNQRQQLVQWNFVTVSELYKLSELIDGAEIYSRIEETDQPESYLDILLKKSEQLKTGTVHEILNLA